MKYKDGNRPSIPLTISSLVIAATARLWVWLIYPLTYGNDSATYIHLARSLFNNHGFSNYNGTRTPGYPLFLIITGAGDLTYFAQILLGLSSTLLLYALAWQLTHNNWLAFTASLFHALNLGQIFFEAAILSETLSTFLLLLDLFLISKVISPQLSTTDPVNSSKNYSLGFAISAGIVSLILASVRPLFLIAPFIAVVVYFFYSKPPSKKVYFLNSAALITPTLLALIVWVSYIYLQFNIIGLDAMGGYHNVNHVSSFFEKAPPEYKQITDIFLKYRELRIAQSGTPVNTIWDAIPELMKATKLNYYSLGRTMGRISSTLIEQNPREYWTNILLGWVWFWKVGVIWQPDAIANITARTFATLIMQAERYLLVLFNALFVLSPILLFIKQKKLFPLFTPTFFFWGMLIWATSLLQTFAEHGDNPRFLAPAQSLLVLFVLMIIFRLAEKDNDETK